MEQSEVVMIARVLRARSGTLTVRDLDTWQTVQVNTPDARRFRPGQLLRIEYNGAMTMSVPPQISARHITRIGCR